MPGSHSNKVVTMRYESALFAFVCKEKVHYAAVQTHLFFRLCAIYQLTLLDIELFMFSPSVTFCQVKCS